MFTGKLNVIGFSILVSLLGAMIGASRKYYLTKVGVHAVTFIDSILTGTILILMIMTHTPPASIFTDMKKLNSYDWFICFLTSLGIAITIIIGRNLLIHNDLAFLEILDGGVDLLATAAIAYFFYNEKMTLQKIGGIILVLLGLAILQ